MTATRLGFVLLGSVVLGLAVYILVLNKVHQDELAKLRDQLASRDKTIEVQKNVYEKLALETEDLRSLLETKDKEVADLVRQLDQSERLWLAVGKLAVYWKHAYEALLEAKQTEEPPVEPGDKPRTKVAFEHDFGYIGVNGYTLSDPPEAFVNIHQNRPLRLALAITQAEDGLWRTSVASSEDDVGVDVALVAVNPRVLRPRWYEKVELDVDAGVGDGMLMGLGVSYPIGHFDVGPRMWVVGDNSITKFYGLSVSWRPFQRD